ncbi:MAG: DUF3368 domain-containing protein [Armatimonadota bacterium]|nr:DUF3368 domain-containing protein [Armatimonadota bacterium]
MIVSDAGPLIALAKIDSLPLLQTLYGLVAIPPAVHAEILAKAGDEASRLNAALQDFVQLAPAPPLAMEIEVATRSLGAGEQQAIALAHSLQLTLLMDDWHGRTVASRLGLQITGVIGVLLLAKEANHIAQVRPLLEAIRRHGYWLSDRLIDMAAQLAGE